MASNSTRFWKELAVQVGEMSERLRNIVKEKGYQLEYANANNEHDREATIELAAELVEIVRTHYESEAITVAEPRDTKGHTDQRWALVRELAEASGVEAPPPLRFEGTSTTIILDAPVGTHDRVSISFDSRLSQQSLIAEIRRLWPTLRARGWVTLARQLGDRKIALVRFVCLESGIETPWPERNRRWNELHPEWAYQPLAAFISAFRRGEKSLTGREYGLSWLYDPDVRRIWGMPLSEIKTALDSGRLTRAEREAAEKACGLRQLAHRPRSEQEFKAWLDAMREKEQASTEGGGNNE